MGNLTGNTDKKSRKTGKNYERSIGKTLGYFGNIIKKAEWVCNMAKELQGLEEGQKTEIHIRGAFKKFPDIFVHAFKSVVDA